MDKMSTYLVILENYMQPTCKYLHLLYEIFFCRQLQTSLYFRLARSKYTNGNLAKIKSELKDFWSNDMDKIGLGLVHCSEDNDSELFLELRPKNVRVIHKERHEE